MKNQRICIIGDGLTGLTTALVLKNLNVDIDLYFSKNMVKKEDKRVTAISVSNYNFFKKDLIKLNKNIFWPCKKINLFYGREEKIFNFFNFEKKNSLSMYIFENKKFKSYAMKSLKKSKVNIINKSINKINYEKSYIQVNKKNHFYDLVILCTGSDSIFYDDFKDSRSIQKDYNEIAISGHIKHTTNLINPRQYFLKEGPLALLPFNKNTASFVWSLDKIFYLRNKKNLKKLLNNQLIKVLSKKNNFKVSAIKSFPLKLNLKTKYYKKNFLILGDGLHKVHPLAGQGFNLVIRDIIKIYELIKINLYLGLQIKNSSILKDFSIARKPENTLMSIGIDMTHNFFKANKFLDPFKKQILKNILKIKNLEKISKIISDKGIQL